MQGPLQIIFSATVLALWALFGLGLAQGTWTPLQWTLLAAGHVCCLVIYRQFAWVFNYGYGLTMLVGSLVVVGQHPSPAGLLVAAMTAAFGLRMLQFTYSRYAHPGYLEGSGRRHRAAPRLPLPFTVFMWVFVSWLMACELMAVAFVAIDGRLSGWVVTGAVIMALGLLLETVADQQKQAAKRIAPEALVMHGLYARMRHPNYTGEILFQAGLIVSCLGAVRGWAQLLLAVLAPAYIIVLMVWSAGQLDASQQARYAGNADHARWRERTASLLPRVG